MLQWLRELRQWAPELRFMHVKNIKFTKIEHILIDALDTAVAVGAETVGA